MPKYPRYEAPVDLRVENVKNAVINIRVSEAVPSIMAQSWPRGSQIAVKKKNSRPIKLKDSMINNILS